MSPAPSRGLFLLSLLVASPLWGQTPPGAGVEELLALARRDSPRLAASRLEAEAARAGVAPAGALEDPRFRVELQNLTNEGSGASPNLLPARVGSVKYSLIQPLPWWGKRDLRQEAAQAVADEAGGRLAGDWSDLAAAIKTEYARHYQASRQHRLARELLVLVSGLERIALVRYREGVAPQADAVRAQLEKTRLESELIRLETERHHAQARLNALLARPADAALAEPERLRSLPGQDRLAPAALAERLAGNSPDLQTAAAQVRGQERQRDLAYRERYPDLSLGVSPMQSGDRISGWELMLEVNIPLQQDRRRQREREAEQRLEAARARQQAELFRLQGALEESRVALAGLEQSRVLIEDSLLPQAKLAWQSALAAYETGGGGFAATLETLQALSRIRMDLIGNLAEQQMRLAEIERLLGDEL